MKHQKISPLPYHNNNSLIQYRTNTTTDLANYRSSVTPKDNSAFEILKKQNTIVVYVDNNSTLFNRAFPNK
jgi:hypothetical protein